MSKSIGSYFDIKNAHILDFSNIIRSYIIDLKIDLLYIDNDLDPWYYIQKGGRIHE